MQLSRAQGSTLALVLGALVWAALILSVQGCEVAETPPAFSRIDPRACLDEHAYAEVACERERWACVTKAPNHTKAALCDRKVGACYTHAGDAAGACLEAAGEPEEAAEVRCLSGCQFEAYLCEHYVTHFRFACPQDLIGGPDGPVCAQLGPQRCPEEREACEELCRTSDLTGGGS